MKATSSFTPTRREIILLVTLFLALLFLVPSSQIFSTTSNSQEKIVVGGGKVSQGDVVNSLQATTTYPEPRLTWTESVPETKMLQHSPGSYKFMLLFVGFRLMSYFNRVEYI